MNTCTHARHVIKVINKSISSNGKENNHHRYNFTYIEYSKSIRYVIIILRGYYCKNRKNI